jgi:hypothetical protein
MSFKRITPADLDTEDLLVSVDSLKNYIAHANLDARQLDELLGDLIEAARTDQIPGTSKDTVLTFVGRMNNSVSRLNPDYAQRANLPWNAWVKLTATEEQADDQFFRSVMCRNELAAIEETRAKGEAAWKKDAEKRWMESAKALLADIEERGKRSTWDNDEHLYARHGGLPAAIIS